VVLASLVGALIVAGCGDDEGADGDPTSTTTTSQVATTSSSTTTAVPEREPSTTTTAFDPATLEGEVEAAYLRSWDVYADAVYHLELDEDALAEVYAGSSFGTRREEIQQRMAEGRAALVRLDHDYDITIVDPDTASVIDHFVNHQVLIDPATKEPIEDDPNEVVLVNFQLKRIDGTWKVTLIQRIAS